MLGWFVGSLSDQIETINPKGMEMVFYLYTRNERFFGAMKPELSQLGQLVGVALLGAADDDGCLFLQCSVAERRNDLNYQHMLGCTDLWPEFLGRVGI